MRAFGGVVGQRYYAQMWPAPSGVMGLSDAAVLKHTQAHDRYSATVLLDQPLLFCRVTPIDLVVGPTWAQFPRAVNLVSTVNGGMSVHKSAVSPSMMPGALTLATSWGFRLIDTPAELFSKKLASPVGLPFSVSFWMSSTAPVNATGNLQTFLSQGSHNSGEYTGVQLAAKLGSDSAGDNRYLILKTSPDLVNGNVTSAQLPSPWNDGVGHHYVLTYSGGVSREFKLYFDAELVISVALTGTPQGLATRPFSLNDNTYCYILGGATSGITGTSIAGKLQDVAMFSHVLTADRVAAHYLVGITPL